MVFQKYNLINTPEMIKAVDDYLMKPSGEPNFPLMAYDTETNGLRLYNTTIVGFSFAVSRHQGFYFPLLKWIPDPKSLKTRTRQKVKIDIMEEGHLECVWTGKIYPEFVKPNEYEMPEFIPALVERWFKQCSLIMMNAPFDINHTFINTGVDLKDNLIADDGLLVHIENENESVALKETYHRYAVDLGISNIWAEANIEKEELIGSIQRNGGNNGHVWRAELGVQGKYACGDSFKTFGIFEVVMARLKTEHNGNFDKIVNWIYTDEVMPVCKEVVVDMKRRGVYIDVPHFQKLFEENAKKLTELEDEWMKIIEPHMSGFDLAESVDEAVSHQRLVKRIIELEGLKVPTTVDKKTGEEKISIAKGVIQKEYAKNPHWIWAYILGEDEIKYSPEKLKQIKQQLYEEINERRYPFNLGSNDHLIWLFFTKLGEDKKQFPKTEKSTAADPKPSLDADNIKELLLPKYPWVSTLLKYKKIQKIQSTYVSPALELNLKGWLHVDMKQNGTTSGRFSCSGGYNLQTLPRVDDELEALEACASCHSKNVEIEVTIEVLANRHCKDCGLVEHDIVRPSAIKKGFIAPPGYKIINADYASLEPRCFAYMSGEDNIKQVYREGLDLYSKVWIDLFDTDKIYSAHPDDKNFLKKVNKKARTMIKPLVLGIPYGAGEAQVANLAGAIKDYTDDEGVKHKYPDMDEGKRLRQLYMRAYPELEFYMLERELEAVTLGHVDAKYGRRRHFEYAKKIATFLRSKIDVGNDFHYVLPLLMRYASKDQLTEAKIEELRILECCYNFMYMPRKATNRTGFAELNKDSGKIVSLSNDDLRVLSHLLGMRYSQEDSGYSEPVVEKGCWSYMRNILKGELNNAKNHPIQALAGHITNIGMLKTNRLFKANGIDGWVCLQVHDEITAYARVDQAELAKKLLQEGMEDNIFTDPLKSEVVMIAEPVICDSLKESK